MNVQVLRKKKDGTRTPVNCPQSISLYNKHMGGVDQNDQLRGYSSRVLIPEVNSILSPEFILSI